MTDWVGEVLERGHAGLPGVSYVQPMMTIKIDHEAETCVVGAPGCSQADGASWPEPRTHHTLTGTDEFRAERIRLACAEGRPEVCDAQPTP